MIKLNVLLTLITVIVLSGCNNKGEIMQASFEVDGMSIKGGML